MDAGRRFAALVEAFDGTPGVRMHGDSGGRGFGAGALKSTARSSLESLAREALEHVRSRRR